jgi:hypothetical protein
MQRLRKRLLSGSDALLTDSGILLAVDWEPHLNLKDLPQPRCSSLWVIKNESHRAFTIVSM